MGGGWGCQKRRRRRRDRGRRWGGGSTREGVAESWSAGGISEVRRGGKEGTHVDESTEVLGVVFRGAEVGVVTYEDGEVEGGFGKWGEYAGA